MELEKRVYIRTDQLTKANADLEHEVSERMKAEKKLAQHSEALERHNRELKQFAYIASHDLQEPLRMVASYTQFLSMRYRDKLDEKANKFIDYAVEGAKRMQELIRSLADYSRAGRDDIPFEVLKSTEILQAAITDLHSAIAKSEAVVTYDTLPTVVSDKVQLTQLFRNLISNAIKFSRDKPPKIHISAKKELEGWVFSVVDNGIGIDPQYFERIFVIFQRLHDRSDYPGTGVGLAICKKIVDRHGGRIWVESEPGKGSIFHFSIPEVSNVNVNG